MSKKKACQQKSNQPQRKSLNRWKALSTVGLILCSGLTGVLALVIARTKATSSRTGAPQAAVKSSIAAQDQTTSNGGAPRNLSLQPEAFNLGRRLGKRFSPVKRVQSVLMGRLTVGAEQRTVRIIRNQTDGGEQVEIALDGSPGPLTWDAGRGALSSGVRAEGHRDLIERLVLDSPDQFVLAQLRGASYYTVARNVGPAEAGDGYAGPLWNVVRVDERQRNEQKRPRSPWRLYYINTRTGLIDRIVCETEGEQITVELSDWAKLNGENVPGEIIWTNQGQTIMQFRLTNFSHAQQ